MLKAIPMLLAACDILHTGLYYFGIDLPALSIIGGISLFTLVFLYLSSYVFKFCEYHRMFLHYVTVNNIISIIDYKYEIGLPYLLYIATIGLLLFGVLYFYLKEKRDVKSNKKSSSKNNR